MLKYIKYSILGFTLFILALPTFAALNLELTQGIQSAIPIAIVPFSGQDNSLQGNDNVAGVISADLQNSGRFKLLNHTSIQQFPTQGSEIDFNYWQKQDINNMVVGSVQPTGGGKYQVNFQLLNVYGNKENSQTSAPSWQNAVILSKTFTVNAQQLRGLSHHISDLIYESLTGDRGIFSTRIAYVTVKRNGSSAQYRLEVSDYDGFNPKSMLDSNQPIMSPSWSPDGRKIAYVSFENGDPAVFIQDIATGNRQKISGYAGLNGAPSWSPNGQQLAVVLTQTGYPKIFLLNLINKQLTQVTQGTAIDTEPNWSPDGNALLFTSNRGGGPQIYKVNLATQEIQRLTFSGNYNARASFVPPEGKAIVVLNGSSNAYNIAVQDLTSGRFTVLTNSGNGQSPSIAPNGKMVVYATQSGGHGVLGVVSTDGRVKQQLPAREGDVREPAWSPFLG